jgi:hypothetical protein
MLKVGLGVSLYNTKDWKGTLNKAGQINNAETYLWDLPVNSQKSVAKILLSLSFATGIYLFLFIYMI